MGVHLTIPDVISEARVSEGREIGQDGVTRTIHDVTTAIDDRAIAPGGGGAMLNEESGDGNAPFWEVRVVIYFGGYRDTENRDSILIYMRFYSSDEQSQGSSW